MRLLVIEDYRPLQQSLTKGLRDAGVHCGLGLALVQRLVRALGGCTIAEVQNGRIFTVQLVLPAKGDSRSIK